ncbi:hypothetical protein QJS10_CPB17g01022 [Acorus calamus]|uniref:Reverse transcriptase zinc-binding domain-containing protein n=1 Tax=Acorus calamus TaxID=4465 RepID=A0AAV9CX15_ACOCL|nr:hypothetical protein QJS10_CPB17g01022 [Acorus calamus]
MEVAVKHIWVDCVSGGDWLLNLRRISCDVQVQEVAELLLCLDQKAPDPCSEDSMVWGENMVENYRVKQGYEWWKRDSPGLTSMMSKNLKIWQWKIPLKVKIFLWLVFQQRILTKSYRAKWRPHMDTTCEFCAVDTETVEHMFCSCPAVMQLWNLISVATSSRIRIQNMEDLWTHMVVAPNLGDEAVQVRVASIITPAAVWAIWLTRNGVVFRNQRFYIENLWEMTVGLIRDWGGSLTGARSVNVYRGKIFIT